MNPPRLTDHLDRLLALLPYLLNNPGVAPDEVCQVFDIDRPTLEADLDLLWMCGLPPYDPFALIDIERDDEHITLSSADYFSRPAALTVAEAQALGSALQILGTKSGIGHTGALDRLLAKIHKALDLPVGQSIEFSSDGTTETSVFTTLRRAIDEARSVRIRYWSASRDETTERTIDPNRLIDVGGQWYVAAFCHAAQAERIFRLDRIAEAELTSSHFERAAAVPDDTYRHGALYAPSPSDRTARVRFSPAAARWASEAWAECAQKTSGDGSVTISIPYAQSSWMVRQVLPYGDQAVILEPADLVADFIRTAREMHARYSG